MNDMPTLNHAAIRFPTSWRNQKLLETRLFYVFLITVWQFLAAINSAFFDAESMPILKIRNTVN